MAAHNSSIEPLGTHAGCSGYNGHLCMTAHKCETCGSTDSSSNLGSCGAVLFTRSTAERCMLYVQSVQRTKGTIEVAAPLHSQASGTSPDVSCMARMDSVGSALRRLRPSVPAQRDHAFARKAMFPVERRGRSSMVIPTKRRGSRSGPPTGPQNACLS